MEKFITQTRESTNNSSAQTDKPKNTVPKEPSSMPTSILTPTPTSTPALTPALVVVTDNEKEHGDSTKRKSQKKSPVWLHFEIIKGGDPNEPRCKCIYCGTQYVCDSRRHGTSSMKVHIEKQCKKYPYRNQEKRQKVLSFQSSAETGSNIVAIGFNKENCRKVLTKMVIMDELPFRFVEGEVFKNFCQVMQPRFSIPSRVTIGRDIHQLFLEKKKLRVELSKGGQRICLTTDCWTSLQNIGYLCLTAHYIDSEWTLQKRILSFCQISSHKGESVGKVIESCLHAWGIERVFTMTVDNASSNDSMIAYLKRKIKGWKGVVFCGEFLHVRCCAHIVNLIVNEGLKELHDSIAAIRNSVRYVRSSPARLLKFKSCVEREKIEYKGLLVLDVPTRWNSTYMMLDAAIKFKKAFERYEEEDDKFVGYFREDDGGKRKIGPPVDDDWKNAKIFVRFLKTFYDITLKFSASLDVTSSSYFNEFCEMQNQLSQLGKQEESILSTMAVSMKKKFDKYSGNVENINCLLFVAVVLDPRYKMEYLTYCLSSVYDSYISEILSKKVKDIMYRLFELYSGDKAKFMANESGRETTTTQEIKTEGGNMCLWSNFVKKMKEKNVSEHKNEVDKYLTDPMEDPTVASFGLLDWWKNNATKYKVLSPIARDILAIPISTVASESAFSTGGRILDPFRSSLSPKMLEALICSQNWLRNGNEIKANEYIELVNEFEDMESDLANSIPTNEGHVGSDCPNVLD